MSAGRFAPTPSGRMHLGNVFSAALAWASARAHGATFVLRMEDIDPRTRAEYAELIRDDLRWLGLGWDVEQAPQAGRSAVYEDALECIRAQAHVYPCFCSRSELHAASAPHASDGTPLYAGTCRKLSDEEVACRMAARPAAWRVEVPALEVSFTDGCQGSYSQRLDAECGDFLLRRSDGIYAYQLAVVVDDIAAGVTEVVRGADLLSSVPRQMWLYDLLGASEPRYFHHPILLAQDGKRLSKRERSLDVGALRECYASPQALLGHIAALAGILDDEEPLSAPELAEIFSWEKVRRSDIVVDQT